MKRFYLSFVSLFVCLFFVLSQCFVSFADVNSLMIGSSSNALMTLELDDSDYLMMSPRSSVGTVTNTVTDTFVQIYVTNGTYTNSFHIKPELVDNRWKFSFSMPSSMNGYYINYVQFFIDNDDYRCNGMPSPSGTYNFSMDFASDFSISGFSRQPNLFSVITPENADYISSSLDLNPSFSSGDFYISPFALNVRSGYTNVRIWTYYKESDNLKNLGGSYAINFKKTTGTGVDLAGGSSAPDSSYESDVSSSLSDLSSSVGEMSDEISGVTEAIQSLQGAMEPHYNNVLTQLHHITEQLHAFWDQQFNLHHVPLMAKLSDIVDAIGNMDLEVEVNLNSLKTSIDTMSQNVQNKLQSVTDTITGGYDNSGIENENNELSGAVGELENAEKEVIDDVTGYIEGFEYPTFESLSGGLLGAIAFFGGFLQSMFLAMGDFGLIITFSLTMIFVLIIVGYHRIRT